MKKKLILAAMVATCVSALIGLTACSDPKNGKSAYDIYVETYISVNGSDVGVLSEKEWLESLKGEQGSQGNNGLSAYEIYKQYTTDNPVLSEAEWLESLKGEQGETGESFWESNLIFNKKCLKIDKITHFSGKISGKISVFTLFFVLKKRLFSFRGSFGAKLFNI